MMDLIACPVCTLYLHKGMSLAEHLETHPKEQVIKALVSLATGSLSSNEILPTSVATKTAAPAESTATSSTNFENFQSTNTTLHSSNNLQTRSTGRGDCPDLSSTLNNFPTSSNFNANIPTTPFISTSFSDVITNRVQNSGASLNYRSSPAYSSGTNGYQIHEPYGLQTNNNMGSQSSSLNFPSHLQHLFNTKTKQLPPPPAYGQAISQLRSQNFARTNTTKSLANLSLNSNNTNSNNCKTISTNINNNNNNHNNDNSYQISSNSSTSYSIVNQQTTNYYTNTNNCQETLDFSLPKQHHQSIAVNNLSPLSAPPYSSSSHLKRVQNSDLSISNGQNFELSTYSQPLDYQTPLSEQFVKFPKINNLEKEGNNARSPSPICLITSVRASDNTLNEAHQTNKSQLHTSSVLRFADTPPAAQYIERESGDFLVQESPRHIVECIEKDNGEFSVIEKVIQSPPSIVSVNEHILEESAEIINDEEDVNNGFRVGADEEEQSCEKNDEPLKNDNNTKFSENDIKIENLENSCENRSTDFIKHNNELRNNRESEQHFSSSNRKLNFKGVKVLSNVKLDPTKSLEIVENIQKCSTEEFWTGIVNTIKKEDIDKSYTCNSLPSTSTSSEMDEIDEQNNLNEEKTTQINMSPSLPVEHATKIVTTSVIRLAVNQKPFESKVACIGKKSNSLEDKDIKEKLSVENEPTASPSTQQIRNQNICGKKNIYKKNPKKLVVKFKNPLPPTAVSPISFIKEHVAEEIIDITENESSKIDSVKAEASSILISNIGKGLKQKFIDDTDETTLNNMMEQIVNEDNISFSAPALDNVNNMCEAVVANVTENFSLKIEKESDFIDIGKFTPIQENTQISSESPFISSSSELSPSSTSYSSSSSSSLPTSNQDVIDSNDVKITKNEESSGESKNFITVKSNDSNIEIDSRVCDEKKSDLSFITSNITKTVFIIEEIDDDRRCERKVSVEQTNQVPGSFLNNDFKRVNCDLSINETLVETSPTEAFVTNSENNKQHIQQPLDHAELVIDIQGNHNNTQQNTYCDYPFSFLYSGTSTVIPNSTNLNFCNGTFTQGTNNQNNSSQHEIIFNSNSSSNSNIIEKTNNSLTSTSTAMSSSVSIYSKSNINDDNAVNGGIQIFNRYMGPTIFSSREENELEEKSSYLDLDLCTKFVANNDRERENTRNSESDGILNISAVPSMSAHNSRDNLVSELNIRTDEKMPAKGEISEQESNGDIENSWSQPIYNELTYKYSNPYDVSHESWSLSHDEFFNPHDLNNIRSKVATNSDLEKDIKPNLPGTSAECVNESKGSKKSKKRKKPTLFSTSTTVLDTVNLNNNTTTLSSLENGQISASIITKKKAYQCDHCSVVFVRLKDRNHHMVSIHQYKRVNRRLIRETPSSTVTSATINNIVNIANHEGDNLNLVCNDTKPDVNDSVNTLVMSSQYIKTENEFPEASQPIVETTIVSTTRNDDIMDNDDKKPDLTVVATRPTVSTNYPRTKYDSIRTNVYRLLMNFNLGVLKQNRNVEIDQNLFNSKSFCCMVCKRDFISVKLFDEHLSEHPAECFTCGKKFSRWTYFSIHLKRHLGWKDFGCTICQKKFVIRSALVEHMRIHTGITPLNCSLCSKSFKRYSNLTQHKRVCHTKKSIRKKDYVCYCGEVLPTKARFIWHKETHDPKPKCCLWCCDRFIHVNSLRRHIRLAHADKFAYNEPAECPICNNIYAKTSLKSHMATHSMETQHECAICNKSFSTKWNLKIHSWVHANRTAKPFKCEHCTKAFVREIDYKNHMNAHKQIRPYTCEYCGCKFIRKYNYLRHRREHHGQKKFSCDLCGKLFHRHYYLIEHRRIHTGERPFLCTICGKSSTTKTNHNKHLKIHHSRDPFTSEA